MLSLSLWFYLLFLTTHLKSFLLWFSDFVSHICLNLFCISLHWTFSNVILKELPLMWIFIYKKFSSLIISPDLNTNLESSTYFLCDFEWLTSLSRFFFYNNYLLERLGEFQSIYFRVYITILLPCSFVPPCLSSNL